MRREPSSLRDFLAPGHLALRGAAVMLRRPFVRRLLVIAGFAACAWLIGGFQAAQAHSAEVPPVPVPSGVGHAAAGDTPGVVRGIVGNANARGADRAAAADVVRAATGRQSRAQAQSPVRAPERRPVRAVVEQATRTAGHQAVQATEQRTTRQAKVVLNAEPAQLVRTVADHAKPAPIASLPLQPALSRSTLMTVDSAAGALTLPIVTTGTAGILQPLTMVEGLVGNLSQQVGDLITPVMEVAAEAVAPVPVLSLTSPFIEDLVPAITHATAPVWTRSSSYPPPPPGGIPLFVRPATASLYPSGGSLGVVCTVGAVSALGVRLGLCGVPEWAACLAVALELGVAPGADVGGSPACLPPIRSLGVTDHLRRDETTAPRSSPDDPPAPPPGHSKHAMPDPSPQSGCGDVARPVEAHVTEMLLPPWADQPPVVRTAADEPAFSPD